MHQVPTDSMHITWGVGQRRLDLSSKDLKRFKSLEQISPLQKAMDGPSRQVTPKSRGLACGGFGGVMWGPWGSPHTVPLHLLGANLASSPTGAARGPCQPLSHGHHHVMAGTPCK